MAKHVGKKTEADVTSTKSSVARAHTLSTKLQFNESTYEFSTDFVPGDTSNPLDVHTTPELIQCLEKGKDVGISGSYLSMSRDGELRRTPIKSKNGFLETFHQGERVLKDHKFKLRESGFGWDGSSEGLVGQDFIPLMGGPFNKQLYMQDYLRMNAACFFAYNHDPAARRAVEIMRDFTLGRSFKIECDNKAALALIRAFEEVNSLYDLMNSLTMELSIYGEVMPWELPDGATKIGYQLRPGQEVPKGIIPRWRLVDPSCIWEIVTYPEDITRKLFYQWVAPTQYQLYSGRDKGSSVPTSKFIFQQIPASEMLHYKINSVSNEKRGRSDLFPALGYMKRLRDSVNYSIISLQKQAAWSIDTTIKGSEQDLDDYVESQKELGTIPAAGSEFVHTESVSRLYLANQAGRGGQSEAFDWAISMIAMATGIPLQYFGTHLSNHGTRASALVQTEPIAKKFEMRQRLLDDVMRAMIGRLFARFGIPKETEFEIIFPEIVTQDRSTKLKDLAVAQSNRWISAKTASQIAAKELGLAKYDYEKEFKQIEIEAAQIAAVAPITQPLSTPGLKDFGDTPDEQPRGMTSDNRKDITKDDRKL